MLYWAFVFLVVALVAGLLGFGGVASTAASIAQALFFVFLIVFVVATPDLTDTAPPRAGCVLGFPKSQPEPGTILAV